VFLLLISKNLSSQNYLKSNNLKSIFPSRDKIMTTEISLIQGTEWFMTTGDNKTRIWDTRSKKMIAELYNENDKRTSINLSCMFNKRLNRLIQIGAAGVNIYSFPDFRLIFHESIKSSGLNDILLHPSWDYFYSLNDGELIKWSCKNGQLVDTLKFEYKIKEYDFSIDSSSIYYKANDYYATADINSPENLKWKKYDINLFSDIDKLVTKDYLIVEKTKDKKNNRAKYLFNNVNKSLSVLDSTGFNVDNISYDKQKNVLLFSLKYRKENPRVVAYSLSKNEIIKKISINPDSSKNKISYITFDINKNIFWIADKYNVAGFDAVSFEQKYLFNQPDILIIQPIGNSLILCGNNNDLKIIEDVNSKLSKKEWQCSYVSYRR